MSDKKNQINDENQTEDGNVENKKSKSKKNDKKSKKSKNLAIQENGDNSEEVSSEGKSAKEDMKSEKKKSEPKKYKGYKFEDEDLPEKIPLLDQPTVVEGSRNRKYIIQPEPKIEVAKPGSVAIPDGKGKPLGKIAIINARIKRLRINTTKDLHKFLFGRIGNITLLTTNIQKFKGFPFSVESDIYTRKLATLNKFHMNEIKELLFFLDLDMKTKKKTDCVKQILDFLVEPKESEKSHNPSPLSHPKRKATKRNYFEIEFENENKKRKRPKSTKEVKKDEKEEANDSKSSSKTKSGRSNEQNSKNDTTKKDEEPDNSSELKKPAKKRKRNQMIEEETENCKKNADSKDDDAQDDDSEGETVEEDSAPSKKKDVSKDKLSDEELRNFLKKVLADVNLESTTMKTVYNLISTQYPTYDFSKKKRFIKGVVKSLIQ